MLFDKFAIQLVNKHEYYYDNKILWCKLVVTLNT